MSDATQFSHRVRMADGSEFVAKSDQRDIAKWELEPFGCGFFEVWTKAPFTFARYLAWSGSRRAKQHALSWTEWGDQCVDVEEEEDQQPADPGNPVASAGP